MGKESVQYGSLEAYILQVLKDSAVELNTHELIQLTGMRATAVYVAVYSLLKRGYINSERGKYSLLGILLYTDAYYITDRGILAIPRQ